jgi:hypothetical protein
MYNILIAFGVMIGVLSMPKDNLFIYIFWSSYQDYTEHYRNVVLIRQFEEHSRALDWTVYPIIML